MSSMFRPRSHSLPSGFGRVLVEKFGRGRFLVIGGNRDELERQFRAGGAEMAWFESAAELASSGLPNGAAGPGAAVGIWFYPRESNADQASARALAAIAKSILLLAEPGTD